MPKQKNGGEVTKRWDIMMEDFFTKKLPPLPEKAKKIIVKYGPWLILVGLVLSIPTLLMALGLWAIFMPSYAGYHYSIGYNVAWWISIASMVLYAWALPGLFKTKMAAWKLMFYGTLVMAAYDLITLSLGGLIIGTGLSLYVLFQIKSYYK